MKELPELPHITSEELEDLRFIHESVYQNWLSLYSLYYAYLKHNSYADLDQQTKDEICSVSEDISIMLGEAEGDVEGIGLNTDDLIEKVTDFTDDLCKYLE